MSKPRKYDISSNEILAAYLGGVLSLDERQMVAEPSHIAAVTISRRSEIEA